MADVVRFRYAKPDLVKAAADRRGLDMSAYLRSVVEAALIADGFSTGPETQYALVLNGEFVKGPRGLLVTSHRPHPVSGETLFEGCPTDAVWLPIENEDSEPFVDGKHYRLKPLPLQVDGDRVVRMYPIISRELA